jgi:predicted dehydrogenase
LSDIRVGLIGYGFAARIFHAPLIAATPGLKATRAAVRGRTSAEAATEDGLGAGGLEDLLADPEIDLVVVATPTADHAEHAQRALAAGKHVVVDKPMATSARDAEALVAIAAQRDRLLTVFHNRRWDADFLALKAVLGSGALGGLVELTSSWDRFRPEVQDRWRERPGPGAGLWWDLGSHLVDQALRLFGAPAEMLADLGAERPGAIVTDRFHVRLRYADGLRVVLQARSVALAPAPRFEAHGTAGSFVKHGLDPQEAALKAGGRPGDPQWGVDPATGRLVLANGGERAAPAPPGDYGAFYAGVRDALRTGAPPPVLATEAVEVVRLLEQVEASGACWMAGRSDGSS